MPRGTIHLPRVTDRIEVMGVAVDRVSEAGAIETTLEGLRAKQGGWICPVNLDVLRKAVREPETRRLVDQADLITADGMPLIWASRLQQTPLPERVAGSSLIRTLPPAADAAGRTIFLLGGDPGVAAEAARQLVRDNPGMPLAGSYCPPFGFEHSPEQLGVIEAELAEAQPDIVFVALGFPKQEQLILRLRPRFPSIWFVSCGISLSYVSGDVSRAPEWAQRLGLEWLHRLAQEPRRLGRRYLLEGIPFFAVLLASALRHRLATNGRAA
jgi:N-acetylglucosaminyldiphosphoundecaprenol N-acetyl-beta-D-mannosaminyltransferase